MNGEGGSAHLGMIEESLPKRLVFFPVTCGQADSESVDFHGPLFSGTVTIQDGKKSRARVHHQIMRETQENRDGDLRND